jgi:formylglycine-generating enzyme required for sulfatase activity
MRGITGKIAAFGIIVFCLSSCEVKAPILSETMPRVVEVTEDKITIAWEPAVLNGHEIKYRVIKIYEDVQYRNLMEGAGKRKTSQSYWTSSDLSETTTTLDNLSSDHEYLIAILAISQKTLVYSMYPLGKVKTRKPPGEEQTRIPVTLTKHEYPEGVKGIDMALVKGGTMEIQETTVRLDSFYMNKYELTNFLYEEIYNWAMDKGYINSEQIINLINWEIAVESEPNMPVRISWDRSITLCNYLSIMEGLTPVYYKENQIDPVLDSTDIISQNFSMDSPDIIYHTFYIDWNADGYRLPTEAEWEFAARGGNWSKKYIYAGSDNLDEAGWTDGPEELHVVGQKKENELYLYDMTGNSLEWCIDPWRDTAEMTPSYNPGRVREYTFDHHLLLKGGAIPFNYYYHDYDPVDHFFSPQTRIRANFSEFAFGESGGFLTQATVRLVRNQYILE